MQSDSVPGTLSQTQYAVLMLSVLRITLANRHAGSFQSQRDLLKKVTAWGRNTLGVDQHQPISDHYIWLPRCALLKVT